MKLIQSLGMGLLALAVATTAMSAQAADGIAKVVNIKGAARFMNAENPNWRPLKSGTVLKQGTVIQTAADSYVDVVLNNPNATAAESSALTSAESSAAGMGGGASNASHSQPRGQQDAVRIYENTVLGLDKLTLTQTGADKVTDTQLDLKAGRILGTVKKLSASSKYEVKIPNGVAGIRGTVYTLTADGVLKVVSGSVVLSYVGNDGTPLTKVVNAGQQYDAKTGQISDIPAAELNALRQDSAGLRNPSNNPAPLVTTAVDPQVYFISPVLASNNNNQ